MDQMTVDLTQCLLRCWDECHELNRNDFLEVVRRDGGVTLLPEKFPMPLGAALVMDYAQIVIATMEHVQESSRGLWVFYIDAPTRRVTMGPREWVLMAVEDALANKERLVLDAFDVGPGENR